MHHRNKSLRHQRAAHARWRMDRADHERANAQATRRAKAGTLELF